MNKIKLDESKIKVDLKQHANYVWIVLEEYSFWVTFFSFIVGVLIAIPTKNAWMLLILPAAPMVCSLYIFAVWIIRRHNIKKGRFIVHTGVFERNKRKDVFFPVKRTRVYEGSYTEHCTETYDFLIFNLGKWLIPDNTLYLWSEEGKLTMDALKFSTQKDDEFYIVTYGKSKKIGYVYNKKLFELDECTEHDEEPE